MQEKMIDRAKDLLLEGKVNRILGWKNIDDYCNPEPAFFNSEADLNNFIYNSFCSANLSKYMISSCKREGNTLIFLKPCDTYSFNQLLSEHLIDRNKAYVIGVGCNGNYVLEDIEKKSLLERCKSCKGKEHKIYDELIKPDMEEELPIVDRFECVKEIESMDPLERFNFWQQELSKCIRCNACRNICSVCNCNKCVFDSDKFDTEQKVNTTTFEGQMFHIIRAYHVAGRCSDCGECTRVCPQGIRLHLLNRKIIKDINELYGEYQAGDKSESSSPLTNFAYDDANPSIINERG